MNNLKKQAQKAFVWDFLGRMSNQVVTFIISIILARILDASELGLVAMVMVVVSFSTVFMDMGLGVSLIQRKEINDYHLGSVFWFNVFVGTILTVIFFSLAPLLAAFYNQPSLVDLVRALAFLFVIQSFGQVVNIRLTRALDLKKPIIAQLLSAIISGVIGVLLAYNDFGVWALVAKTLLGAFIYSFLLIVLARFKPVFVFKWSALKELWGFGMRMFLSRIIDTLYVSIDSVIIGKLFPPSQLAFYDMSKKTKNTIVSNAVGSLGKVLLPSLSKVQDDDVLFKNTVYKSLQLIIFISLLLLGLFFVISNDIFIILLTEKWSSSVPLFRLMLLSAYIYPVSVILVNVIISKGNSKNFLRLEIYKKLILTLNFIIGFLFGIEGFLLGSFIASLINVSLNIHFASKEVNVKQMQFHKMIWLYFLLTVSIVGVVYFMFDFSIFSCK